MYVGDGKIIKTCAHCGLPMRYSTDYYMLRHELWRRAIGREDGVGMLHVTCAEARLGRNLKQRDFLPKCAVNEGIFGFNIKAFVP